MIGCVIRLENTSLFSEDVHHFVKNPAILDIDNHESQVSIAVYVKENGFIILTCTLHCSYKLQPLDVSVYGSLKAYYILADNEMMLR